MKPTAETRDESLESMFSENVIKLRDILLQRGSEERLVDVAAKIRPLPENIAPSANFLHQMRQRLLQLPDSGHQSQKAA